MHDVIYRIRLDVIFSTDRKGIERRFFFSSAQNFRKKNVLIFVFVFCLVGTKTYFGVYFIPRQHNIFLSTTCSLEIQVVSKKLFFLFQVHD